MPISDIDTDKDAAATYLPLLLATFTFSDASVLRCSTHPLSVAEGGHQYGGNDYTARILNQSIASVQGMSEQGIDVVPRVSLTLADPDKFLWINYNRASGKGFRGAQLQLTFVFYDPIAGAFSSDSLVPFIGICNAPECDHETLNVSAQSKINLTRRYLPAVPIQRRCPWIFPTTAAERQAGADDSSSIFFQCGYSPDASGGNARGNGSFTSCAFTKADCVARGMYSTDGSARVTGRFGGVQWDPPAGGRSREYTSGQWLEIVNNPNQAKYGEFFPMVYGTARVDAVVMNVVGDGNSTRGEAVVCLGEAEEIIQVVVNDRILPPATDITGGVNYIVRDALLRYNVINRGDRSGAPNLDSPFVGSGDPYGSLCTILWVVPRSVAETGGTPRVQVLVRGPKIRVYTGVSTYTDSHTANPVWAIMDILAWSGLSYSDMDIQTFIDAAAVCDASISYTDQYGGSSSHARYSLSLVIRQRRSVADVLRGVRQSCNAMLAVNPATGKLQVFIKQTLADQQPSAPDGTNYGTGVASKNAAGTPTNGFVAYDFTASNIARDRDGNSTFRIVPRDNNDAPNVVAFNFLNSERDYAGDSLRLFDTTDLIRMGGLDTVENLRVDGINTLDQAKRIGAAMLAEGLKGNSQNDSRGTDYYELEASFRAVKLRAGHICRLSEPQSGLSNQLVRLLSIQPTADWRRCKLLFAFHNDDWYVNTFGQVPDPARTEQRRNREERASFPWAPNSGQPASGDSIFATTDFSFSLEELHPADGDGGGAVQLHVRGQTPVNVFADIAAPLVGRQGTTASTGGSIAGSKAYYMAVCSIDADGLLSAPSQFCEIVVTNSGSANTITIPVLQWPTGHAAYAVFAGNTPERLTYQGTAAASPASITLTAYSESTWNLPDIEFDKFRVKIKRMVHSGVWGARIASVSSPAITIEGAAFGVDDYAGYDVSLLSSPDPAVNGFLPVRNWNVTSNTADTLTVTGPGFGGSAQAGAVLVMRSKPTVGSDAGGNYVQDVRWTNNLSGGAGLAVDAEIGNILRIFAGTGRGHTYKIKSNTADKVYIEGDWITTPDNTTRYVIEEPTWQVIQDSDSINNATGAVGAQFTLSDLYADMTNYRAQTVGIQIFTMDGGENESLASLSPWRDIYIQGNVYGTLVNTSPYNVTEDDRILLVDASANRTINLRSVVNGKPLTIKVRNGSSTVTLAPSGSETVETTTVTNAMEIIPDKNDAKWYSLVGSTGSATSGLFRLAQTLTAATTAITRAIEAAPALLIVVLTQDATGGRQITWGSAFHSSTPVDILNMAANKQTRLLFESDGTNWRLISGGEAS